MVYNEINGTAGNDHIIGTDGQDYVSADWNGNQASGAGDDLIEVGGGDDAVEAGDGRDTISGGSGNDDIFPDGPAWGEISSYVDAIAAGRFDDVIWAGAGNDSVIASPGTDTVGLGSGDDFYTNAMALGPGSYLYYSHPGNDIVYGGSGNDVIQGHTVYGGGDDDALFEVHQTGETSKSKIFGGAGNDSIHVSHNAYAGGGAGDDTISLEYQETVTSDGDFTGLTFTYSPTGQNSVYGGAGNDLILRVASGNNNIWGGAGNDHVMNGQSPIGPDDTAPASLGGDSFFFAVGHAAMGGDLIEGFQHGVDKIDLTRYDRDGDGAGDLSRADVTLVALGNNTTEIHFNGELITIVSDSALTWDDVLL